MSFVSIFIMSFGIGLSAAQAEEYGWTEVVLSNFSSAVKVTGRVTPLEGALNIESARIQGRVLAILAREGDLVKPGTALFTISSGECLSLAEEKRVAEKKQIADLIEGVQNREKQLALRLHDDRCEIVASYLGAITKRSVESGATFNIGDSLVTILDTKRLSVELDIAERDLARVHAGEKVQFHLATEPAKTYSTTIKAVVPAIDTTSRTARVRLSPVRLSAQANLDGLIFGEIETGSSEPVFTIPSQSLVFNKNSRFVVKGPESGPVAVEVEVLGETNGISSVRPKKTGELNKADQVATSHAIFLFKKISEGPQQI